MSYLKYSPFLKKKFGVKVQKVSIDAGFTCPNQDGTKGVGGCTSVSYTHLTLPTKRIV